MFEPWHSTYSFVHHTHPDCDEGQHLKARAQSQHLVQGGTGNKPLCPECARLTQKDIPPYIQDHYSMR